MRIFPRSHYGQFCSANALLRSISLLINGVLVGIFLDVLTRWLGQQRAYICIPLWNFFYMIVALAATILLYRSWKRYGGDAAYLPPMIDAKVVAPESDPEYALQERGTKAE